MTEDVTTTSLPPLRMPRRAIFVVILGCTVALSFGIRWYLEPWYLARQIGRQMLDLNVSPASLPDKGVSTLDPARLEMFEYSFQSPWGKMAGRKDLEHAAFLIWQNGPMITAYEPVLRSDSHKMLIPQEPGSRDLLRPALVNHGYNRLADELKATPDQIHWWDRSGTARVASLLLSKEIEQTHGPITYRIENDELRGFQFSDHSVGPERIVLILFDVNSRRYELNIDSPPGFRKPTQADINALVASFRPVPHS